MSKVKRKQAMDKLLFDIQVKREKMIACGLQNGFDSAATLQLSQELDVLIVKYQKHKEQLDKLRTRQALVSLHSLRKWKLYLSKMSIVGVLSSLLK